MNVVQVLNVKLQRADQSVSWGFNLQGGKDFCSPLLIQKVNNNSLADKCSIRTGDFILRIGSMNVEHLTHNQARDAIIRQGNYLEMTLQRGAPPRAEDYNSKFDFPQHQLMTPENMPAQVPALSPQVGIQLSNNKALLTQSYNSPMGLYSTQNIADTLVTSIQNIKDPLLKQLAHSIQPEPFLSKKSELCSKKTFQIKPSQTSNSISSANPTYGHANAASARTPLITNSISSNNFSYSSPPAPQSPRNQSSSQFQFQQPQKQFSAPQQPPQRPAAYNNFSAPAPPPPRGGQRSFQRHNRGSALLNTGSSNNLPTCAVCSQLVRGPFVSAVGKIWCPHHFVCAHQSCGTNLQDVGFVEENGRLYCERDFEAYFAPTCYKCNTKILTDCCYALERSFHPECFTCAKCKQKIGSNIFHIEDGVPYCVRDFNALFSTKCAGCEFPIEAGDKFVEAINQKWHQECFVCSTCNMPLQSGFATKGSKPYCRKHAY